MFKTGSVAAYTARGDTVKCTGERKGEEEGERKEEKCTENGPRPEVSVINLLTSTFY